MPETKNSERKLKDQSSKWHDSNEELTRELILLVSIHQDMVSKSER